MPDLLFRLYSKLRRVVLNFLGVPVELMSFYQCWRTIGGSNSDLSRLNAELQAIHAIASEISSIENKKNLVDALFEFTSQLRDHEQRLSEFNSELACYRALASGRENQLILDSEIFPCLYDKTSTTGFDRHYLYHPLWALSKLFEYRPEVHVDIASSLYFSAYATLFCSVKFYDYRPADIELNNIECGKADLTKLNFQDASIPSLSCMHVIEHIGLGRYGDPLDPFGDKKAAKELIRVLAKNGNLLIVLPFGKSRTEFNAHRVYSFDDAINLFADLSLKEFALIPESSADGGVVVNPSISLMAKQNYGCGCYWFRKS